MKFGGTPILRLHFFLSRLSVFIVFCEVVGGLLSAPLMFVADNTNLKTLTPEELVSLLKDKFVKPLLFQVGSHTLYAQAHIPGSEYLGAGNTREGLRRLSDRVNKLPKKTSIILYCGCCLWNHCPNVSPTYEALAKIGFTDIWALYIANNFRFDWVDKGYSFYQGRVVTRL
jgi:thiosulfate/3-mercaptopyruvate sulfurtransferase